MISLDPNERWRGRALSIWKEVLEAPTEHWIDLKIHGHIKGGVSFEFDDNLKGFYWKIDNGGGWNYTFSMRTLNYIRYFKTLKGCKRNFKRRYLTKYCFYDI